MHKVFASLHARCARTAEYLFCFIGSFYGMLFKKGNGQKWDFYYPNNIARGYAQMFDKAFVNGVVNRLILKNLQSLLFKAVEVFDRKNIFC